MEEENLHLFITEEIYLLEQDKKAEELSQGTLDQVDEKTTEPEDEPNQESPELSKQEVTEEPVPEVEVKKEVKTEETPAHVESKQDSPEIPTHSRDSPKEIPFAVFHSSENSSDIELLNKIIAACKVPQDQYKIFGGGFDQSIQFKKALVFVPEAKAFYTPIPYKSSEFLCSKPLDQISGDVQEKAKLWSALQAFVDTLQ